MEGIFCEAAGWSGGKSDRKRKRNWNERGRKKLEWDEIQNAIRKLKDGKAAGTGSSGKYRNMGAGL